jgi:hypothetical protein|nr:hypothetical protein [Thiocapsa sp.]
MSFDALTITGFIAATLCGGFLIALTKRDDGVWRRPRRTDGSDQTLGNAPWR